MGFIVSLILLSSCFNGALVYGFNIATASSYDPPYTPTRCNGNAGDQFPADYLFASVREELWDGGAACGRRYTVTCLSGIDDKRSSSSSSSACIADQVIVVVVVDFCSTRNGKPCPATFLLSNQAFSAISTSQSALLNVEFNPI